MKLRRAGPADAPVLVERWCQMFAELGAAPADDDVRATFTDYLARKLPSTEFAAWVAEESGEVVATAAVILYEIPGRGDVTHEAYAINVFTLVRWRQRGLAKKLMQELIAFVKTRPVRKLWLRTAPKAVSLYARAGFSPRPEFMEIDLKS